MVRYLTIALLVAGALAQEPNPEQAFGSIEGIVRNAITRAPIPGAIVHIDEFSATTAVNGEFAFKRVPVGRYWMSVHDSKHAADAGVYVLITAGQTTTIEISIKLGGSMSGMVTDDQRRPVAGVAVIALEPQFEFGELAYARYRTVHTQEDGTYRVEPVKSDRGYLILAKKRLTLLPPEQVSDDVDKRERVLDPTYYPRSTDVGGAQTITLSPGEDRAGLDILMASEPSYCVQGELEVVRHALPPTLSIGEEQSLVDESLFSPATIAVKAEGDFHTCGLHSGGYRLHGRSGAISNPPDPASVSTSAQILITNHDLKDIKLEARLPTAMAGRIEWNVPQGTSLPKSITVSLSKVLKIGSAADEAGEPSSRGAMFGYPRRVHEPWSFTIDRIPFDTYSMSISGLSPGCYLKFASYGTQTVQRLLRLTESGPAAQLHLHISCDGGSLTARVNDSDGNPISEANVYLMPAEVGSPGDLSEVIQTATAEKGWASFNGPLRPGKYLLLACNMEMDGTTEPIIKLWNNRSRAKEVEITPQMATQATVEVVVLH